MLYYITEAKVKEFILYLVFKTQTEQTFHYSCYFSVFGLKINLFYAYFKGVYYCNSV